MLQKPAVSFCQHLRNICSSFQLLFSTLHPILWYIRNCTQSCTSFTTSFVGFSARADGARCRWMHSSRWQQMCQMLWVSPLCCIRATRHDGSPSIATNVEPRCGQELHGPNRPNQNSIVCDTRRSTLRCKRQKLCRGAAHGMTVVLSVAWTSPCSFCVII